MKKRTVWFGVPVYVVRMFMPFAVVSGLVVAWYLLSALLTGTDWNPLKGMGNGWLSIGLDMLPGAVPLVWLWVLASRVGAYEKRVKSTRGRVCFVCSYEIGEGLERCSECGARWSLEDLNAGWRKMAEGKEKKSKTEE